MPRNPRNSNPILCECDFAKVAHSRARPPGFSRSSVQWSYVVRPRQLFQAGIAILARKVTMDDMPSWNFSTAAGAIDMLRPALRGAFSGTGTSSFQFPSFSMSHKDQTFAFNASTAAGPIRIRQRPSPTQRPGRTGELPRLSVAMLYRPCPPVPSWSSPHQWTTDRGVVEGLESGPIEWPTRTL